MFYIAHGPPDSCGRGCDRWIAVEGQINADAAGRFKAFIKRHLKDRQLPMYFSSPGGNLEQAIFIGNMLRELSATARVARTIVKDCGFEAQTSEVCLKLKRSGRELAADLSTRNTQCNSACPYLILGATTREVAPDAILGVHSPKVVLRYSGGVPTREMVTAATQRGVERADRLLSSYVVKMGIEGELLDVAKHTKYEDMHVLTRDEIFRFGIDRREFVETPWAFENLGRALIRKSAVSHGENGKTWRTLQWRLFCRNAEQFQLDFQRQVGTTAAVATISISSGAAKPFTFAFPPAKPAGYEVWGLRLPKSSAQAIADLPEIDLTETANALDGRRLVHGEKLSTEGLAASLASLQGTCPLPKDPQPKDVLPNDVPVKELTPPPPALPQNSAAK
ncbi:MAG TPA: hypothetical protein VN838_16850 [Bradyrhizobium sp.]|nr:hypothetical protein [Bradyrhizobium sp.]